MSEDVASAEMPESVRLPGVRQAALAGDFAPDVLVLAVVAVGAVLALLGAAPALGQTADEAPIHWGFAPFLGTGLYRAGDVEEIYALSAKPGWRWREASLAAGRERRLGMRFRLTLTASVHSLDDGFRFDDVSTLSAVPGVEIEIPMTERWRLKPLVHLGYGTRLRDSDSASIYWTGIRSAYAFEPGRLRWQIVNSLTAVGYSPNDSSSERLVPLLTAFEFRHPLAERKLGGDPVFLHWHVAHTNYIDDSTTGDIAWDREWELGVAFGKGDQRMRLGPLGLDRVGIAWRFDNAGDFDGIRLVFGSLFDR